MRAADEVEEATSSGGGERDRALRGIGAGVSEAHPDLDRGLGRREGTQYVERLASESRVHEEVETVLCVHDGKAQPNSRLTAIANHVSTSSVLELRDERAQGDAPETAILAVQLFHDVEGLLFAADVHEATSAARRIELEVTIEAVGHHALFDRAVDVLLRIGVAAEDSAGEGEGRRFGWYTHQVRSLSWSRIGVVVRFCTRARAKNCSALY